ncbi:MAG: hypothetical protein HYX65_05655 [Gemmatimonadetes bacterium]|nr:hypothetical protein [Gemmatimonadota bacterium]
MMPGAAVLITLGARTVRGTFLRGMPGDRVAVHVAGRVGEAWVPAAQVTLDLREPEAV